VAREESARRAALADRLEEDRHAFQRDTLLELQDELQRLARATTRILLQDERTVKESDRQKAVEGFVDACSRAVFPRPGEIRMRFSPGYVGNRHV
jgi:hypothetical protein